MAVLTTSLVGGVLVLVPRPARAAESEAVLTSEPAQLEPVPSDGDDAVTSQQTRAFGLIGVSFPLGNIPEGATVSLHEPGGDWGPAVPLTGGDHGPDPGSAEAESATVNSDPIWVGEADGYRVSAPGQEGGDVTVHMVSDEAAAGVRTEPEETGTAGASDVTSRFWWGAAAYRGTPVYASGLDRAIVHHTVNANDYEADEVPAMLRAIQSYHQNANGWDDIGYNFVVDRFGRVWEGRAGSIDHATVGAHTSGRNTRSVGVAFLGDGRFSSPSATVNAAGSLLSWKMPRHGATPGPGNIVGHLDLNATACPGHLLYGDLGTIANRARAKRPGPDNHIRRGRQSVFGGDNVYNRTGAGQSRLTRVRKGGRTTFVVRVQNDGDTRDSFRVRGTGSSRRFAVRYYAGSQGISRRMRAGSYRVVLDPGGVGYLRVVVSTRPASRRGSMRSFSITSTSTELGNRDRVKAIVRRR